MSKGLSIKQITQIFLEGESPTLERRKIECMSGTFVALQKILTSK